MILLIRHKSRKQKALVAVKVQWNPIYLGSSGPLQCGLDGIAVFFKRMRDMAVSLLT